MLRMLSPNGPIKVDVIKAHILKLNKTLCELFPDIKGKRPISYYHKEGKYHAWFNIGMDESADPEGDIYDEIKARFQRNATKDVILRSRR
jgi:hypothetical protein